MKKIIILILLLIASKMVHSQGYNHQWLIGYWPAPYFNGRFNFDTASFIYNQELRDMKFRGADGSISDAQGNFLMSSNGVWVANANNDTMLNGAGLNPGPFVDQWSNGLPFVNTNVFFQFPGDTTKFVLIHQVVDDPINNTLSSIFFSTVDLTLDSGLGGIINKNTLIVSDSLSQGMAVCKHANGRDWWIVFMKDNTSIIYKVLFTPSGVSSISTQQLNFIPIAVENASQLTFSQDGTKLIYSTYDDPVLRNSFLVYLDFDRCSGSLSNVNSVQLTSGSYLWGLSFSPNGKYIYVNSASNIFQIDTNGLLIDTVAFYDGFISGAPPNCCQTSFMFEYLAANGKIYLTSGNGVQHLHEINYPDSAGLACDVQQHAINLGVWHFRSVPNHPNYNLGPVVGSACDTLTIGIEEIKHDFKFSISPNPTSDEYIKLVYLLPQNKAGVFEVYNMTGQRVYEMNLPAWSTLQFVKLPELSNGVYTCVIRSGYERSATKLVLMR